MIYYLKHSLDIVQNFYFIIERRDNKSEWNWYEENIVKYFENQLRLKNTFTSKQIHRAIGLINVNAVALQMPKLTHAKFRDFLAIQRRKMPHKCCLLLSKKLHHFAYARYTVIFKVM